MAGNRYTRWVKGNSFIFFYPSYIEAREAWARFRGSLQAGRRVGKPLYISAHMRNTGLPTENGPKRNDTHGWYFTDAVHDSAQVKKVDGQWALLVSEPELLERK